MKHRHLQDVHYLEFTRVFNYEVPDDFSFVKTMKFIYIYFEFCCVSLHVVPWVLKHNTELTNYQAKEFQLARKDPF